MEEGAITGTYCKAKLYSTAVGKKSDSMGLGLDLSLVCWLGATHAIR